MDTEKVLEAGFAGLIAKQGDLTTIRAKPARSPVSMAGFFHATKFYTTLLTGNVFEVSEKGSQIFD